MDFEVPVIKNRWIDRREARIETRAERRETRKERRKEDEHNNRYEKREKEERRERLEKRGKLGKTGPGVQNEAPRLPKPAQDTFWTPKGTLRALWGWFWEALGALLGPS